MRVRLLMPSFVAILVALALCLDGTPGWTQGFGKKGGGDYGGGFGDFGGKGKKGGDTERNFERLAQGKGYFLISEQKNNAEAMKLFAQRNGIWNDRMSLEQYSRYSEQRDSLNQELRALGLMPEKGKGGKGRGNITDPAEKERTFKQMSKGNDFVDVSSRKESDSIRLFAERIGARDYKLNKNLYFKYLEEREKWDNEMKAVMSTKGYGKDNYGSNNWNNNWNNKKDTTGAIVLPDVTYTPPMVYRPGNLPAELPSWFTDLDKLPSGPDSQVSMLEWVRGKGQKSLEEFLKYDRNEDGLITVDELLYFQRQGAIITAQSDLGDLTTNSLAEPKAEPAFPFQGEVRITGADGKALTIPPGMFDPSSGKAFAPTEEMKKFFESAQKGGGPIKIQLGGSSGASFEISPELMKRGEEMRKQMESWKSLPPDEQRKMRENLMKGLGGDMLKGLGGDALKGLFRGRGDQKDQAPPDARKK